MKDVNGRKLAVLIAAGRVAAGRLANRGVGVMENIGWKDEARAASLAVRRKKALLGSPPAGASAKPAHTAIRSGVVTTSRPVNPSAGGIPLSSPAGRSVAQSGTVSSEVPVIRSGVVTTSRPADLSAGGVPLSSPELRRVAPFGTEPPAGAVPPGVSAGVVSAQPFAYAGPQGGLVGTGQGKLIERDGQLFMVRGRALIPVSKG